MPDIANIIVGTDHTVRVGPASGLVTVKNVSGGTVYYSSSTDVSSGQNEGTLTTGQSAQFSTQVHLRANASTIVSLTTERRSGVSFGSLAAATTLGSVVGKHAIYDPAGGLVGYVPVYNSIT